MYSAWPSIFYRLDYGRDLVWEHAEAERWAEGELDRYLASGLFAPAKPLERMNCTGCGQIIEVLITGQDGTACLLCSECGPHRVPIECVSCWRLDWSLFLAQLCTALEITSRHTEVVPGRVWRLGKWRCGGASRTAYLARQLQRRDAPQVLEQANLPRASVVFVPTQGPRPELRIEALPRLVPLLDVLSWSESGLALDKAHIEDQLGLTDRAAESTPASRKRDSRLSAIGLIKLELIEHVRAARDYARETRDRTGTPQLLPRPTREQLAKRLGVHRTTVSRCFEDGSAPELVTLWDLAADIDRILAFRAR